MNLGPGELLLLGVLALLAFGPKRLPEIARSVGKALRAFQQETSKAMEELKGATDTTGIFDRPDASARQPAPLPTPPSVAPPPSTPAPVSEAPPSKEAVALEDT